MRGLKKRFSNGLEVELIAYFPRLEDWYKTSEQETHKWLCDNVKRDWICVEVGAHIGYTSMLLSTMCQHVYAFEPNAKAIQMFNANLMHNAEILNKDFDNVDLYCHAVGDKSGMRAETLYLAGEGDKFGEIHGEFVFVTLDEIMLKHIDINRLSLLFIDADGWDYDVLMGAKRCIEIFHPYIIMEANYALAWRGHKLQDVYDFADKYEYKHQWLDEQCPGNLLLC